MKYLLSRMALAVVVMLGVVAPAHAHVGNKDVFEQVEAGPYKLFVTIRPPNVIPGVAGIEVRSSGAAVSSIAVTPTPLTGEASKHPPSSDALVRTECRSGVLYGIVVVDGFGIMAGAVCGGWRGGQSNS